MTKTKSWCVPSNRAMNKKTQTSSSSEAEKDIDLAVKRVYQMFGPDLSVFFNAVKDQARLERHDKRDQEPHARTKRTNP